MNFVKKINKEELKNSLQESIVYNEDALDYIKNKKIAIDNLYKYNSEDVSIREELNILKYIEITLEHVGAMYEQNLKKVKNGRF